MFPLFSRSSRRLACAVLLAAPLSLRAVDEATEMLTRYRSQVTSQLTVPALEVARFAQLVELELQRAAKPLGIQVYGAKGLRVFNFGWQQVAKGWGDGTVSQIRLQMHATDPDLMERRLGSAQSTGGVHIPASLNRLLDHHGVLDADYVQALREGRTIDVLLGDRDQVRYPGRYLVVVDSGRTERPDWSPAPFLPHRRPTNPAPR